MDGLPSRPKFNRSEITIGGETLELYHRNVIECVRALYGKAEFAPHLVYKPERHYADQDMTNRLYSDMHTGKWWWETQVCMYICSAINQAHALMSLTENYRK